MTRMNNVVEMLTDDSHVMTLRSIISDIIMSKTDKLISDINIATCRDIPRVIRSQCVDTAKCDNCPIPTAEGNDVRFINGRGDLIHYFYLCDSCHALARPIIREANLRIRQAFDSYLSIITGFFISKTFNARCIRCDSQRYTKWWIPYDQICPQICSSCILSIKWTRYRTACLTIRQVLIRDVCLLIEYHILHA